MSKLNDHFNVEKQKEELCDNAKLKLLEKKAELAKQIEETDNLIKSIETSKTAFKQLETSYNKRKNEALVAVTSLYGILMNPSGICKKFPKLKEKGEQSLADIQTQLEIKCTIPLSVYSDDLQSTIKPEDVVGKKLVLSKLLLTVNRSDEINCGFQILDLM